MVRCDIWTVDFGDPVGSEPAYVRPAIIVQNDKLNKSNFNTVIVIPLTTNLRLADYEGNVFIPCNKIGLQKDSVAVVPQITAIDKCCLLDFVGKVPSKIMKEISTALKFALNL